MKRGNPCTGTACAKALRQYREMKGSKQEQQAEEEENEAGEQAECMVGKFDFLSSVQLLSCVRLFVTHGLQHPDFPVHHHSRRLLKRMSLESVIPSNHLILCRPLLLLPSIFPSIRVFSNESVLRIRWPKYWSFSFSISPSSEHPGLISFRMDWLDLLAVQGTLRVFSNTTVQKHQFFGAQLSL
ncbi:unnamed protein product [Rangifer tarandus platyrhynchus]|uniref:Uncharacterized protein n=2 Tax=Rangifer tarandus platyrhynchus TaxID=3082113 RepID=A0AC59Z2K2_RANTA|nr:unnamed protein product [Rangifer tarandus platyrhynchus]